MWFHDMLFTMWFHDMLFTIWFHDMLFIMWFHDMLFNKWFHGMLFETCGFMSCCSCGCMTCCSNMWFHVKLLRNLLVRASVVWCVCLQVLLFEAVLC